MSIAKLALLIDANWNEAKAIDWTEAEALVEALRSMENLNAYPQLHAIVTYASANADWDCSEVGNWPAVIVNELNGI